MHRRVLIRLRVAAMMHRSERGTSLVEYALLGIFVAVAVAAAVQILGDNTDGKMQQFVDDWNGATGGGA